MSISSTNNDKIRVVFLYKDTNPFLTGMNHNSTIYHFFMDSLKRNNRLDVTYFPCGDSFDASELKDKFDVILLPDDTYGSIPDKTIGFDKLNMPVICRCSDPHRYQEIERFGYHKKYKIDYYFNILPVGYFHKFYPMSFKYRTIIYGLEPSLYQNVKSFKDRIKNKILNSGVVARRDFVRRIAIRILDPKNNMWYHYKLRTMCNELPYVEYKSFKYDKYAKDQYPLMLQQYRGGIAATTYMPTIKYFEIPAAGCLTFMEITDTNMGAYLGYKDGKTAVFINENDYKEKFKEYLDSADNPEWEEIANAGRSYALREFNNDKAVDSLADLMEELL